MCDVIDLCAAVIKNMLNLPTVAYTSHGATPGNSFFPEIMSITPSMIAPISDDLDFAGRFINCLGHLFTQLVTVPLTNREMKRFTKEHNITFNTPMSNTFVNALILLGNNFVLEHPRPFMPNVIHVGGWYVQPPNPLEGDLRTFMDQSGQGVVYISFGTLIEHTERGNILPIVFKKLPNQRFVLKYNGPEMEVPENVFVADWVPQNNLLAHENIRLFVTHCGSHSSYETIYHGVPIVAIPLFSDQPSNAHRLVQRLHMGILVVYQTMTEDTLRNAIRDVLLNDTYKENAMRARSLQLDQQTTPLSRVKFYIDYVIRHKGIDKLASKP